MWLRQVLMLSLGKFVIALEYFKHTLIYFFIINILKDYYQQVERNVFLLKHLQIPRGKFFFFQHACAHTQHLLGKILYELLIVHYFEIWYVWHKKIKRSYLYCKIILINCILKRKLFLILSNVYWTCNSTLKIWRFQHD